MLVDENEGCESRRDYMFVEKANDKGFDPGWVECWYWFMGLYNPATSQRSMMLYIFFLF